MKVRIKFQKRGALRFIGHLDLMRFFQKVMRRAEIPMAYSGGFNPHMIMSFASPLGIGITSDGEYLDIQLTAPISSAEAVKRMNEVLVEGIEIISFRQIAEEKKMTGMSILAAADYRCQAGSLLSEVLHASARKDLAKSKERLTKALEKTLLYNQPKSIVDIADLTIDTDLLWQEKWAQFMALAEILVIKQTKRSEQEVDIKPMIYRCNPGRKGEVFLQLAAGSVENLKPNLVVKAFCEYHQLPITDTSFSYHRLEMYANIGDRGERQLVSLESLGEEINC